jgi:hypothetical protein
MAVYLTSHCNAPNGRDRIVLQLSRLIEIDSLGDCVPMFQSRPIAAGNRTFRASGARSGDPGWQSRKLELISRYKFVFAFENSNCFDYVTEKPIDAWRVGAVPVYFGAPNIDDYTPSAELPSLINVEMFNGSIERLAEHLSRIAANEKEYMSYLKWRDAGPGAFRRSGLFREIQIQLLAKPWDKFCEML